jgi:two-component system sensor histidine kinase SenX3
VRLPVTTVLIVAGAVGLVLLLLVVRALMARRSVSRRLSALSARIGDPELGVEGKGMEASLGHLERLVDDTVIRSGEERLEVSRMERALGALSQGVILGDEQGTVIYRNRSAVELLGGDEPDPEVERQVGELLAAAVDGRGGESTLEVGRPPRAVTVVSSSLDDGSRTLGAVLVLDDVSDRERLDAVRRDFVANITHELKTPVSALGLLADTIATEEDPVVRQRLARRLQTEAGRVGRVMDDLLDLSRIEADENPVREPVMVHLLVAQAAERVRGAAQDKGITINFGEPPQRLSVVGDRRQLVSAIYNVIENAVKFSPPGSTVEVRARPDGDRVELSVRDRGVGIPPGDLERIFERFYRSDRSRSLTVPGTGLGLAIVRHVVGNHDGDIRVDSKEGEGSTFTLRLPAGPRAPQPL